MRGLIGSRPGAALESLATEAEACRADLLAFARRQLGRRGDAAEDMVQDAMVRLLARARAGDPPRAVRGWLFAVVRSGCTAERARAERVRPGDLSEVAAPARGPEEVALAGAESRWLLEQVAALPESERRAVVAHLAGVPDGDAVRRGRSANAAHQALFRGRARLRRAREAAWAGICLPLPLRSWLGRWAPGIVEAPAGVDATSRLGRIAAVGALTVAGAVSAGPIVHLARHLASAPPPQAPPPHALPAGTVAAGARTASPEGQAPTAQRPRRPRPAVSATARAARRGGATGVVVVRRSVRSPGPRAPAAFGALRDAAPSNREAPPVMRPFTGAPSREEMTGGADPAGSGSPTPGDVVPGGAGPDSATGPPTGRDTPAPSDSTTSGDATTVGGSPDASAADPTATDQTATDQTATDQTATDQTAADQTTAGGPPDTSTGGGDSTTAPPGP